MPNIYFNIQYIHIFNKYIIIKLYSTENDTAASDYPVPRDGKFLWIKKESGGDVSQVLMIMVNQLIPTLIW